MIVEFYDGSTPMLAAIRTTSRSVAFEVMSKVGNEIRENARSSMKRERVKRQVVRKDRKKRPEVHSAIEWTGQDDSGWKTLGDRQGQDGKQYTKGGKSMANFITSFLMEKSGVLVVGGVHKGFRPILRKDGKEVGRGTYVHGISKQSQAILHNLDTGEKNGWYGMGKNNQIKRGNPLWRDDQYIANQNRGYGFMQEGYRASRGYMQKELSKGWDRTIGRSINKVKIKTRKVA